MCMYMYFLVQILLNTLAITFLILGIHYVMAFISFSHYRIHVYYRHMFVVSGKHVCSTLPVWCVFSCHSIFSPFSPVRRFSFRVFHHLVSGNNIWRSGDFQPDVNYPEKTEGEFTPKLIHLFLIPH